MDDDDEADASAYAAAPLTTHADSSDRADVPTPEQRWPMTIAVLALVCLPFLLPERYTLGPSWLLSIIEALFLVAIVIGDPGRIDRRSSVMRALGLGLIVVFIVGAVTMTALLVRDLIHGAPALNEAGPLLATGSLVWINNNITFSLLYWELDGGGPAARATRTPAYPDLAFPQHMNPEIKRPGWRPVFPDYLYLGFTNATAFSPTDVMPTAHWAKLAMTVQSLISIVILSLVIARAVNIFS